MKLLDLLQEQRVVYDKSKTDNIVNSFETQGHHKWFDNIDPEITKQIPARTLEQSLKYGLGYLTKIYGYNLKRVVVKDKNVIVGFLIWTNKGKELDNLGDNQTYPVIIATAIHPDYRGRGLLKMMINKSNIEKPYLVQTSTLSPIGLWQKMGCNVVKDIGDGNKIEKCN
jgi:ribosomal protein S18 acetylase RimI-like enzyme